ncbi:MAG TPA: hypothetical protein VN734_05530 [Acidobacteriaceae bacterium]|nr:hypothetical protein [Acidobacteriaceae bacterium]
MNSPNNNLTPPQPRTSTDLESRIDRIIERKPEVQIPTDFAAKIAARAVAQPLRRRRYKPQFGPMIALLSAPLAVLALFVLAPYAAPNVKSLSFDTEVVFLTELAFIGWWVARTFNPKMNR